MDLPQRADRIEQAMLAQLEERLEQMERRLSDQMRQLQTDVRHSNDVNRIEETKAGIGYVQQTTIPDGAITASTYHNESWLPHFGRLNRPEFCWHSLTPNPREWIQVDLGRPRTVVAVLTQGSPHLGHAMWMTKFAVSFSPDGESFTYYDGGREFRGNYDRHSIVRTPLVPPLVARVVRIHVLEYNHYPGLRFELCVKPLGDDE